MKKLFLPILFFVFSFAVNASDIIQPDDSLRLLQNITDVNLQIKQQKQLSDESQLNEEWHIISGDTVIGAAIADSTLLPLPEKVQSLSLSDTLSLISRSYFDSIYERGSDGILKLPPYQDDSYLLDGLTFGDTLFYNPLFLPMIFNGKLLPRNLSFFPTEEDRVGERLILPEETFALRLQHADFIQKVRNNYYFTNPDKINYSLLDIDSLASTVDGDAVVKETFNPFRELLQSKTAYTLEAPGVEMVTINRKYWIKSGEHSFQFAQNYFSDNWHKGGTNNLNINSYNVLRANYSKNKVKFNNMLEWRLSVFNAPDDTIRSYRIGNDLLRYYGNFGITAFGKGWTYTMNLEAKSQVFNSYPSNSENLLSSFLSPLYVNSGIGLTYNVNKPSKTVRHRRTVWNLTLAPVSINYKYVANDSVNVVRFGIPKDEKSVLDIGTTVTSILKVTFTKYIVWDSRLTYFTSYKKVVSEFENGLNMALSNALSTRIHLNVRFDDGVPPHEDFRYWHINQTLSFGLNYKW